jgi:hypothetical protein
MRHISVGFIMDTATSSLSSNIGSSIAYCDQEALFLMKRPFKYICYKSEQLAQSFAQSYVTSAITNHIMTIPTILISDKTITDDMLKIIAPTTNIVVGLGVSAAIGIYKGKSGKEILKESFNAGLNNSLTTSAMTFAKETALMKSLNEISKSVATKILINSGIAIPHTFVASIVISTSLCLLQRICVTTYNLITKKYKEMKYSKAKKLAFLKRVNQGRIHDIFYDLKANDSFFTEGESHLQDQNDSFFVKGESSHLVNQNDPMLIEDKPSEFKTSSLQGDTFFSYGEKSHLIGQEDSFFSNGEKSYLSSQGDPLFRQTPQVAVGDPFF